MNDYRYMEFTHAVSQTSTHNKANFYNHCHNFWEFLYFVGGDANYVIENRTYELKPHTLVLIAPTHYHFLLPKSQSDTAYDRFVIHVDESLVQKVLGRNLQFLPETVFLGENSTATDILYSTYEYLQKANDETFSTVFPGILTSFLLSIDFFHSAKTPKAKLSHSLVGNVIDFIDENFTGDCSLDRIAKEFFVSKSHLCHKFSEDMKISPTKYVVMKRLTYAQKLITSGMNAYDACFKSGFNDYSNFYKSYVAYFKSSPSKSK